MSNEKKFPLKAEIISHCFFQDDGSDRVVSWFYQWMVISNRDKIEDDKFNFFHLSLGYHCTDTDTIF